MMILMCYPFKTFTRASVKAFVSLDCYCTGSPLVCVHWLTVLSNVFVWCGMVSLLLGVRGMKQLSNVASVSSILT